nr:MAG TPA: Neck appendage protein [Caudoviricetes sp.]
MTIKASSQITISKVIDIYACYRYYKLQGSTLAKPTKPTKNPPDGWSDTEPAYISGSTNTLYFVDCNVYSDKTFSFSEVSKSSSYEAAKDAWNKANKAQDTATNAQNKVDNLQIGGRNLKLNGDFKKGLTAYGTEGDVNVSIENDVTYTKCAKVVFSTAYASERLYTTDYNNRYNLLNTVYTLSFVAKASSNLKLNVYRAGTAQGIGETNLSTEWKKFEMTYTATGTGSVTFKLNSAGTLYLANIKLELGNKATDWTPAPEDLIKSITEANTAIEKTDEKISMKASVDSVTEISNRANEIEGMLSEAKTTIARHEESIQMLTSDEFTVKFTNLVQQITSVDGKFEQYKEKMDNWLRFDKNGNLIIGSTRVPGQPAYEIMISKNRISFLLNDIEVAYISDDEMHINKSTVMESITIGRENQKFIWEMRGNGNLGLVWR